MVDWVYSQVARHGDAVAAMMAEAGLSLDDMMDQLAEERRQYYEQRYRKGTGILGNCHGAEDQLHPGTGEVGPASR